MTHDNEKHEAQLVEYNKFIQTNNAKLYSLHHNNIREVDGNCELIYTINAIYKLYVTIMFLKLMGTVKLLTIIQI